MTACCNPVIPATSIVTNTTTGISTITLAVAPPASGPFKLCICNESCSPQSPLCYTPCEASGQVEFSFTPTGATTPTVVTEVYGCNGGPLYLASLIKAKQPIPFYSNFGTGGAIVAKRKLPCANTQFSTTTTTTTE